MNSLSLPQVDADILLLSEHKLVTMCISCKTKCPFLDNSEYIFKIGVLYLVASTCVSPVARYYFSVAIMIQKLFEITAAFIIQWFFFFFFTIFMFWLSYSLFVFR